MVEEAPHIREAIDWHVLGQSAICRQARGGDVISAAGTDWLDAYEEAMTAAHGPARGVAAE